jgi:hypothetical protein
MKKNLIKSLIVLVGLNALAMQPGQQPPQKPGMIVVAGDFALALTNVLMTMLWLRNQAPIHPAESQTFHTHLDAYRNANSAETRRAAVRQLENFFTQNQIQVTIQENAQQGNLPITHTAVVDQTRAGARDRWFAERAQTIFNLVLEESPARRRQVANRDREE